MSIRAKCRIILGLSLVIALPGLATLASLSGSAWKAGLVFFSAWLSGQFFVVAMIGDGKEGLGLKRDAEAER